MWVVLLLHKIPSIFSLKLFLEIRNFVRWIHVYRNGDISVDMGTRLWAAWQRNWGSIPGSSSNKFSILQCLQTNFEAHSDSYPMGARLYLFRHKAGGAVKLTTHHLIFSLKFHRAILHSPVCLHGLVLLCAKEQLFTCPCRMITLLKLSHIQNALQWNRQTSTACLGGYSKQKVSYKPWSIWLRYRDLGRNDYSP
jgi:hypothetical protein